MSNETKKLVSIQSKTFSKIQQNKVLLLGTGEEESKHDHIKSILGWNETDAIINDELRKTMELQAASDEHAGSIILSEHILIDNCIKDNYALANVRDYKGKIPKELLDAIYNYTNSGNNLRLEANVNDLFLYFPLSELEANNNSLDTSKRYRKGSIDKIILFERILKGNKYKSDHYKVIHEMGRKKPIRNFYRSLYYTHALPTCFQETIGITSTVGGIILILTMLGILFGCGCYDNLNSPWFTYSILALLIIHISHIIVNRDNSLPEKTYDKNKLKYMTNFMVNHLQKEESVSIKTVNNRVNLGKVFIIIAISALFFGVLEGGRAYGKYRQEQQLKQVIKNKK